jgi:dipeptidyl aminopeptidase/acylaminoacyl peptidase
MTIKTDGFSLINLTNGQQIEIEKQHDEAWIGGPGISEWNEEEGVLNFLTDDETIYFQSEVTGYSHLYTINLKTKVKQQLTSGKYEIHGVKLSKDGKTFYLTSNKLHPGNREFYSFEIVSKKLNPILTQEGAHEINLSPDEKTMAVRFSSSNKPWELYIAPNVVNSKMLQITKSTSKQF